VCLKIQENQNLFEEQAIIIFIEDHYTFEHRGGLIFGLKSFDATVVSGISVLII